MRVSTQSCPTNGLHRPLWNPYVVLQRLFTAVIR